MTLLTQNQVDDIKDRLHEGMTPETVADYYGRIADLDLGDVAMIRSAAYAIERGETVPTQQD